MSVERERADRLKRLLDVQERKRRLAEWRLADLRREDASLAATSAAIIDSLGTQSLLNGLFLEGKAKALRRNEAAIAANRRAIDEAARLLADAQGVEKRMERAVADAEIVAQRREEGETLALALDDWLAAPRASLE